MESRFYYGSFNGGYEYENPIDESVNSMDNMADSMMIETDPMMRDSMIK